MWRDEDLRVLPKGMTCGKRFAAHDIKHCRRDLPSIEGGEQRIFINKRSARRVNQVCASWHRRKSRSIQQVFRLRGVRGQQNQNFALSEQFL